MNHGPLIFLGAFFALVTSWFGMIFSPQLQLGGARLETNLVNPAELYPQPRPGLAQEGLQVYRSLGCAACHSQQVRESGRVYHVVLTESGTNQTELIQAIAQIKPDARADETLRLILPITVVHGADRRAADAAVDKLRAAGAKAEVAIVPFGPDIERIPSWGKRRSVAADFLYDQPVMPGSQRIGPDLANVGLWNPGANWHLLHLYAPRIVEKKSVMPPYRFLFEKRKIGPQPSPEALNLPGEFAPEAGYEIVPKDEAKALVAYLLSLRADTPLFEVPLTVPASATPAAGTNAPAGVSTNSPPP